jgi:hypothetical protein
MAETTLAAWAAKTSKGPTAQPNITGFFKKVIDRFS